MILKFFFQIQALEIDYIKEKEIKKFNETEVYQSINY
jgi:hypothetical protein